MYLFMDLARSGIYVISLFFEVQCATTCTAVRTEESSAYSKDSSGGQSPNSILHKKNPEELMFVQNFILD